MIAEVRAFIAAHQMTSAGALVVVAVSGGPDSLCLIHVLAALRDELGVTLHIAHLDHMIRGAESAAEAQFVADTAQRWALPATVEAIDVPALAQRTRTNLHAAARYARYAFLARVALAVGAQAVAVAHHAGDQAETVLLHLLRGAGPAGLSGMRPVVAWEEWAQDKQTRRQGESAQATVPLSPCLLVSPSLIRPLLTITRDQIERYCAEQRLEPRQDPSNLKLDATRNRIRHDLLPRLVEYNPHVVAALGRTAVISADEHAFVHAALDAAWPRLVQERAGAFDFDGHVWDSLHPALQRAAIRRAHERLVRHDEGDSVTLELEHVEQARALIGRGVGRRLGLPGAVALTVGYGGAFTIGDPPELDGPQLDVESVVLPAAGRVSLAAGWELEVAQISAVAVVPKSEFAIQLDADQIQAPLVARRRRPGDRMPLPSGRGNRRLQDLFVDAKVPRALRDNWPIIATSDTIIWVAGLRADNTFLATPESRDVIQIRIIRNT